MVACFLSAPPPRGRRRAADGDQGEVNAAPRDAKFVASESPTGPYRRAPIVGSGGRGTENPEGQGSVGYGGPL
ncbi:unnamed protein product [Lota lota]